MSACAAIFCIVTDSQGRRFAVRYDKIAAVTVLSPTLTSIYMFGGVDMQVEAPFDEVCAAIDLAAANSLAFARGTEVTP